MLYVVITDGVVNEVQITDKDYSSGQVNCFNTGTVEPVSSYLVTVLDVPTTQVAEPEAPVETPETEQAPQA